MFKISNVFKKKAKYWLVIFRDHRGNVKTAKVRAESRLHAADEMERIFKKAEFIDAII